MKRTIGAAVALVISASVAHAAWAGMAPAAVAASTTHTVAAEGPADFTSIQSAVDAAAAGDIVVVMPGTYEETVVIDKDLSLLGDGPADEILLVASAPVGPTDGQAETQARGLIGGNRPFAVHLSGESVTVADLTVVTPDGTTGVAVTAGAPVIERVVFAGPEELEARISAHVHRPFASMAFYGPVDATVRDSAWDGYVAVRDGASVLFDRNDVLGDTVSIDGPGTSSVRDSVLHRGSISMSFGVTGVIEGNEFYGDISQLGIDSGSDVEVVGNSFRGGVEDAAVWVQDRDTSATIDGNVVVDGRYGLRITDGASVVATGNTLEATSIGVSITGTDAQLTDNVITSDGAGVVIVGEADATISGNSIEAGGRAVVVGRDAAPSISGNVICGEQASLFIEDGADPTLDDNMVCDEAEGE